MDCAIRRDCLLNFSSTRSISSLRRKLHSKNVYSQIHGMESGFSVWGTFPGFEELKINLKGAGRTSSIVDFQISKTIEYWLLRVICDCGKCIS
jgi:hypothetical protein